MATLYPKMYTSGNGLLWTLIGHPAATMDVMAIQILVSSTHWLYLIVSCKIYADTPLLNPLNLLY